MSPDFSQKLEKKHVQYNKKGGISLTVLVYWHTLRRHQILPPIPPQRQQADVRQVNYKPWRKGWKCQRDIFYMTKLITNMRLTLHLPTAI
jgi:hypothetical protein